MTVGPRSSTAKAAGQRSSNTNSAGRHALSRDSIAGWIAMALAGSWVGYLLFTGMPQLTLHVFPRTLTLHVLVAGLAMIYVAYLALARRLPGGTPLDIPVLALIGAYALGTYTSINWRVSLEATLQFSIALVAFYALSDLPFLSARQLRRALMAAGFALSLYALWVVGSDYLDYLRLANKVEGLSASNIFPATVPRVHDVSDHPNVLAMLLTLVLPFFALSAYAGDSRWERAAGFAGVFVGGWAMFLTLSRSGWIGAALGITFTGAAAWVTLRVHERERQGKPLSWDAVVPGSVTPTAIAAIGGALALVIFGSIAFLSNSSTRPGWLFRSSLSPRQDAWHVGRQIFSDHLLTGAGPNTFGLLYPQYSKHAGEFIVHTQHAHNGFLQAADDIGIIGLLALAALAVAIVAVLWRTWRAGTIEQRLIAIACAGALLGFSLHNQLDAGNIWKAPGVALAVIGAIIARNFMELPADARRFAVVPASVDVRRYGGWALRASLLLLLAVPFLAWYRVDRAHYDYWQGVEKSNKGEPGAIEKLQAAVNADSSMMVYQMQLGQVQATAYDHGGRNDQPLIDAAVIHLRRAVVLDPRSDLARANLARTLQLAGHADEAADEARLTRLSTYHVPPVLLAGEVYEELGRDTDAISTYGQVISMDAGLANSTYWDGTAFRREHLAEILGASTIGINQCTLGAYLVEAHRSFQSATPGGAALPDSADPGFSAGKLADAKKGCQFLIFTAGLGNDLVIRTALAKIQMAQGDLDGAFGQLDFAVKRQPDFGPARTELGRWYATKGNLDEARHQWVVGGQLEQAESVLLLGDSYPAGQVPAEVQSRLEDLLKISGSSVQNDLISILYYRLRYARISPVFALIPADWQKAVPRPYAEMQATLARWRSP